MSIKILRLNEVCKMLGVGKSTLSYWQDPKNHLFRPDFPKKIALGAKAVGYFEHEIVQYAENLARKVQ